MKKLSNTAKKIDFFAKILFWALVVGGVIMVAASLFIVLADGSILDGAAHTVTLGPISFDIAEQYAPDARVARIQFGIGAVIVSIAAVIICLAIHYVRKILEPMKNERPFDGTVHKNIRKLAWLILFGGATGSILTAAGTAVMAAAYDFAGIFDTEAITAIGADITVDCSFVVFFALLYLLSYVFKYGEELQTQSDETL